MGDQRRLAGVRLALTLAFSFGSLACYGSHAAPRDFDDVCEAAPDRCSAEDGCMGVCDVGCVSAERDCSERACSAGSYCQHIVTVCSTHRIRQEWHVCMPDDPVPAGERRCGIRQDGSGSTCAEAEFCCHALDRCMDFDQRESCPFR
tara:strand:- start:91 stop:531 length:441 start_codon:yes stop_codon:yes gene_type:complete